MAIWGSGTLEDPWKVTDWDNFVSRCVEQDTDSDTRSYIEFPTHDQNGNLIPIEERIIDLRHREWYINENTDYYIIHMRRFKTIEGNGWTILGLSIRNMSLFNLDKRGNSTYKNRGRDFEMKNLNFQNLYIHGRCILFRHDTDGARFSISGCKFSGIFDASIGDIYSNDLRNACCIINGGEYYGWSVFTACSFNFKFIVGMRIEWIGRENYSSEFNNCLFNIEGKPKVFTNGDPTGSPAYQCGVYHLFYSTFYFCKFTGKLLIDCAETYERTGWLGTYSNRAGSSNVIDIALKKVNMPYDYFRYPYYLGYSSFNDNEATIRYFDRTDLPVDTSGFDFRTNKSSVFKIPADRDQMIDKDWLEANDFIVGIAPTT